MYLKQITLTNFKAYSSLVYSCNDNFNIIIGENNIGKSTLYDAMLLWKLAYTKLIQSNNKDFYKKTSYNSMNINFTQFLIFRLIDANDLFYNPKKPAFIELIIVDNDSNEYDLEIRLNTPEIKNSYVRFTNADKLEEFNRFSMYCKSNNIKLQEAIQIQLTKPITTVLKEEPFLNKAQIQKKTYLGFSLETLRNKILSTIDNRKFDYLESKLNDILGGEYKIKFKNSNRDDDEFINITIEKDNKEVDLLLVGSGVLHVLEIFSTLYMSNKDNNNTVNLLLLDEPDSHIHADIQAKLIDELKLEANIQTFIITHNDRLIEKAAEGELFYINKFTKTSSLLNFTSLSDYKLIKKDLSGIFTHLNSLAEDKPLIITEGKTDWKHFKAALEHFQNQGKYESIDIDFLEYENEMEMGDSQLRTLLKEISKVPRRNKIIGIFDCDTSIGKYYENTDNQVLSDTVYAIAIPTPSFREYHDGICVEFLYKDVDLKKEDQNSRRIYLSEEFSEKGRLLVDKTIVVTNADKIKRNTSREKSLIIDKDVTDIYDNSLALSKSDFAKNVLEKVEPFDNMKFRGFKKLFEKIEEILE